jgi:catecholate siderophore receptor
MSLQYLDSEAVSQSPATNGRHLQLTPEVSGNLWATYRLPRDIRIGGGVRYNDDVFVNAANTIVIPSYALADALVEAPIGEHLILRFNVYNVTDRTFIRNINNNAGRYNPGTPRSFLLSSAFRF